MTEPKRFERLLIANRGEIAIRIHRACAELGIRTIGIHSDEDRYALHRFKADEAYSLGEGGNPVGVYLDIPRILEIAKDRGADAIHPGYGFLSERADFARAVTEAGMTFVGPPSSVLSSVGDKVSARSAAIEAGLPVIPGSSPIEDPQSGLEFAREIGFPVMVKASGGGGGRGMRVVHEESEFIEEFDAARREAASAFGNDEVFVEKLVERPKHIEVQILADTHGNVVHLYERDCSIQRRHQKVLELAPAPNLDPTLRADLCAAAVRFAEAVGYQNAGTVEFLVSGSDYYFIEMNPRVQVEHTVTEEITGVDIVGSQIRIASGATLAELGIEQASIVPRDFAIQCRVTTENPENRFLPDYGRLISYRSPGGLGVRLDAGNAFPGALITPYYDSLLAKLTTRGRDLEEASSRALRALGEFRVRGVETNIAFLRKVIENPTFQAGRCDTHFIAETPGLLDFQGDRGVGTRLLEYLADVTVNGRPNVERIEPDSIRQSPVVPAFDRTVEPAAGTKQRFDELGAEGFAKWMRDHEPTLVTDTTFRDAHQSLLATRMRTADMLAVAPALARLAPQLFSLEVWGGATFDVSMRFLDEDPWKRLEELRSAVPNILLQMLLRGANAVGYTTYPDNVVKEFIKEARARGVDLFRIFDSLNWADQMQVAIDATREAGGLAEVAICYTGDILDPSREKYALQYYVDLARDLVDRGAHVLAIKDMAGLLKPYAARRLVEVLRAEIDVPIHLHSHDTAGIQGAAYLQAVEAGVDAIDCAFGPLSGSTSQPNLQSVVAMLAASPRPTELDFESLLPFDAYWESVRSTYKAFDKGPFHGSAEVYEHEIPGGQYTNLRTQATAMGLGERWRDVTKMYAEVNRLFGDVVKVTPSSKVVGDMALYMLSNGLSPRDVSERGADLTFPDSVIEYFEGRIGRPPNGFPEPLRSFVLKGRTPIEGRPGADLPAADFDASRSELANKIGREPEDVEVLSYILYPRVFLDFVERQERHGPYLAALPTVAFFHGMGLGQEIHLEPEPGKGLVIRLVAIGDPDSEGNRQVFFDLNGQPRRIVVHDRSSGVIVERHPKADAEDPNQVGAPLPGLLASHTHAVGDIVVAGERLCVIEAMKMESNVTAPLSGRIAEIHIAEGEQIEAGDLLITLEPEEA
ncbi:MAG TPA: pyruvate carboxylase [Deltaproteobacteria bacterium]|nr:pyruvate carboxylase [Deltaproteobacteria bacterium]